MEEVPGRISDTDLSLRSDAEGSSNQESRNLQARDQTGAGRTDALYRKGSRRCCRRSLTYSRRGVLRKLIETASDRRDRPLFLRYKRPRQYGSSAQVGLSF